MRATTNVSSTTRPTNGPLPLGVIWSGAGVDQVHFSVEFKLETSEKPGKPCFLGLMVKRLPPCDPCATEALSTAPDLTTLLVQFYAVAAAEKSLHRHGVYHIRLVAATAHGEATARHATLRESA